MTKGLQLGLGLRATAFALCVGFATCSVPRVLCGWSADGYFDGELASQDPMGRRVARSILEQNSRQFFRTGIARFDGQSAIAIYQMAILGMGQIVLEHPDSRAHYLPAIRAAADALVDPRTHPYAARKYGQHAAVRMDPGEGHAYAGYINLALGMVRLIDPDTPHGQLHDRLTETFARRLDRSPTGMVETYPGETWPPDVAAVAGSIGLHGRATGKDWQPLLRRWSERFAECAVHDTGYLAQRVRTGGCRPLDAPRGSGTAVGAYFISFAVPTLARRLHDAMVKEGHRTFLGFGGVKEYAAGHRGAGDVNAGPILLGISVGATGYGLGSARVHQDRETFTTLYRTTDLFGIPRESGDERSFVMGGALGDALLLAMLTARSP